MKGVADYVFERSLWSGNHGTFWLARTPARLEVDDPVVAVKVLDQYASDDEFRRMTNELKLFAAVSSPHLVQLYDAGHHDGRLYYSSEYHPDGSLAAPASALEPATIVQAVADAARAAHALHEAGVAHRDIKPSNVLLADGRGRLTDLGLAQVLNPGQTVTGVGPLGAIEYVSPETLRGDPAGRASDIWGLGATLHGALSGASLYPGLPESSLLEALRHVLASPPLIASSLPAAANEVVARTLQSDPADRHPTADALADELDAIAARGLA
ncbi:MAG: serine/threonine-protein kinase [Actinomycetota bacterium]